MKICIICEEEVSRFKKNGSKICLSCDRKRTKKYENTPIGKAHKLFRNRSENTRSKIWLDSTPEEKNKFIKWATEQLTTIGYPAIKFKLVDVDGKRLAELIDGHGNFTMKIEARNSLSETISIVEPYEPNDLDTRKFKTQKKPLRKDREKFRELSLSYHGTMCVFTGVKNEKVLEIAHIKSWKGDNDNHIQNLIPIRADVHKIFDCYQIGVEPNTLTIHVRKDVSCSEYRRYHGEKLLADKAKISFKALTIKWDEYVKEHEKLFKTKPTF